MMTRKDYVKIAKALSNARKRTTTNNEYDHFTFEERTIYRLGLVDLIDELCTIFKEDNPNFDRARFLTACNEEG